MRIKGIDFRRGFFKPQMFPHLRLASQVLESVARFNGTGIRQCAGVMLDDQRIFCNRWMPYMNPENGEWQDIKVLDYLDRHIFKGLDLKASHGVCPKCYDVYDRNLTERGL